MVVKGIVQMLLPVCVRCAVGVCVLMGVVVLCRWLIDSRVCVIEIDVMRVRVHNRCLVGSKMHVLKGRGRRRRRRRRW